jgi:hypothetical protein
MIYYLWLLNIRANSEVAEILDANDVKEGLGKLRTADPYILT